MERLAKFGVVAFKTYTQWGPSGTGFWMTDDVGIAFVEKARKLGVRNICIHKGLPFGPKSYEHSTCRDIGPIAKRFPDMNFLIYHSGFVAGKTKGPTIRKRTDGIDALVTSLEESGVKPNSNVYAELGSTWRFLSMRDPDTAAHAMGKLFKYVRRGQRAVGHGLDLVRLAAGPDPGVPHVPDLGGAARQARLPEDHAAAARQGVRAECHQALSTRGATSCENSRNVTRSRNRKPSIPGDQIQRT